MELTKICEHCGLEFSKPQFVSRAKWPARRYCGNACFRAAVRNPATCTICGVAFGRRYGKQMTCGSEDCKREHKTRHAVPKLVARMKADYASGKRTPAEGISRREKALWPLLAPHGWLWRLRWTEADGQFELDFSHRGAMVNVEIDGAEHGWTKRRTLDEVRDAELERRGWTIVRISNEDVDADPEGVAARIVELAAPIVAA